MPQGDDTANPSQPQPSKSADGSTHVRYPPPQSEGGPRRFFTTGSPASGERLNAAIKILRDPIARTTFSRPYSGQARNWNR